MQIYQSPLLNKQKKLLHAFTGREVGNLAFHVQDDTKRVIANHKQLAQLLKYDYTALVHMQQIHSNQLHKVNEKDNFFNPPTCDSLITDKKNIPLMVIVADCTPLLFYEPKNKVIAVAHAGRAGAFKNIVSVVIQSFIQDFHTKPEDIVVSVGASIGSCCYEVGEAIYKECSALDLTYAIERKGEKYFLDINKISYTQLLENGIKKENIDALNICSACNTQNFFSYRKEKETGRFAGVIMLN